MFEERSLKKWSSLNEAFKKKSEIILFELNVYATIR